MMKKHELVLCGKNLGTYEQMDTDSVGAQYGGVTFNDDIFENFVAVHDSSIENEDLTINVDLETGEVYILHPFLLLWRIKL